MAVAKAASHRQAGEIALGKPTRGYKTRRNKTSDKLVFAAAIPAPLKLV
jgi:hypothetical protein